jgi:hypothetical protein
MAEEVLDTGTLRDHSHLQGTGLRRSDSDSLVERRLAFGEVAGRGQRMCMCQQKFDSLLSRSRVREQAKCAFEPVGCARGRAWCGCFSRLAQRRDRLDVTDARTSLDVMSPRRRRRASGGKRLGTALVGSEPPRYGRRLVHRAADERVPESEPPGHLGWAHQIDAQQVVEAPDRRRLGHRCAGSRKVEVEGITGDRRTFQHAPRFGG